MPGYLSVRPQDWADPAPPAGGPGVFVGSSGGLFAYTPSGDAWADITPDSGDSTITGVAAIAGHLWAVSDTPILYHSTDNGTTWTTDSLPGSGGSCDSINALNGLTLVGVRNDCASSSDNGLYTRPADGSSGWTKIVSGGTDFTWQGDIVSTTLFYTQNSGSTRHFHKRSPVSSGGSDTSFSSTGASGTQVAVRAEPSDDTVCYACVGFDFTPGPAHLYRINGTTPTDVSPIAGSSSGKGVVDAASDGAGVLLALTWSGGTVEVYRSTDFGATWSSVHSGGTGWASWPQLGWSAATPGTVYALVGLGVAVSTDGGLTWTDSSDAPDTPFSLAVL